MKKLNCILLILTLCITNTFAQNKALRLNGKNEYAKAENLDLESNTVTFSLWIKPEGTQNSFAGILISQTGNRVGIIVRENNELGYMWNDDQYWNIASGLYLPENEWSYIAVVIAPKQTTLYINGETRTIKHPNKVVKLNNFLLGKDRNSNRYFKGAIADLKIWTTCLTVDQLNESKTKEVLTEQLFAYWKFDGQTQVITNPQNNKQTLQCIGGTQNENSDKEWSKINVRKEFKFAPQMLKNDVDTLAKYLVETHPDIYFKKPKPQFEKEISDLKSEITDSLTLNQFFVKVAPFVTSLGDGHTGIWYRYWENPNNKVFPYEVKLNLKNPYIKISDCLLTTQENTIPPQSEIITINGLPAKQIKEKIMQYASGESDEFRLKQAEGAFSAYFYMLFPSNSYSIKYKHNNKLYSTQIMAVEVAEWYDFQRNKNAGINTAPYTMSLRENNSVAYIDFRACIEPERFKVFIDSCFTVIKDKKIEQLIIDVRSNGGGNSSISDEFFQYISPVAFHQYQKITAKHSPLQNSTNPNQIAFDGKPYGFIQTYEGFKYISLRENPKRYRGKIYLLTSSYTFSSASDFTQAFKHYKMGKIIGEETGGWIISFGDILYSKLPNSNLPFAVSFKKFYNIGATENDYHGTYPDVKIESDKALDYTLQLIREKKLRK